MPATAKSAATSEVDLTSDKIKETAARMRAVSVRINVIANKKKSGTVSEATRANASVTTMMITIMTS